MDKQKIINWAKAAGIRAVKTMAESFIAMVGTGTVMQDINWAMVGSATLLSGILSLVSSLAGLPEIKQEEKIKALKTQIGE